MSTQPDHNPDENGWCQNDGCMWNSWNAKSDPPCPTKLPKRAGTIQEQEELLHGRPPEPTGDAGEVELREKLAAIEHERWASWQNYVHSFLTWDKNLEAWVLPHEWKDRWQMQVNTPYSMLSEAEKQSDMEEVDRYWPLITASNQAAEAKGRRELAQRLASSNNWRVDLEAALGDTNDHQ